MVTKHWPSGVSEGTPYQRAAQTWDERVGSAVNQARNWRRVAFASLALLALSIAGTIYLGAQPKLVPHIVQIDQIGQAAYHGRAGQAAYTPNETVIKYHLRRFVQSTRSLSSDPEVVRKNWLDAYNLLTQGGANYLTAYIQKAGNDPFQRAKQERVSVDVIAIVPVSKTTWQVDWRESKTDLTGTATDPPTLWRGMFRITLQTPTTEAALTKNPIGLYIDELHWDQVQG